MDIYEFFRRGGVVKCKDQSESDQVIVVCRDSGFQIFEEHGPSCPYHGVYYAHKLIMLCKIGSSRWRNGMPFQEWMDQYDPNTVLPDIEDLI